MIPMMKYISPMQEKMKKRLMKQYKRYPVENKKLFYSWGFCFTIFIIFIVPLDILVMIKIFNNPNQDNIIILIVFIFTTLIVSLYYITLVQVIIHIHESEKSVSEKNQDV